MNQPGTKTIYSIRPCTFVYIVLMVLTVITWLVGKAGLHGLEVSLFVLAFALFKGLLIGDYYMGLRGIKGIWRWVIIIWLVLPGGLITWAFVGAS